MVVSGLCRTFFRWLQPADAVRSKCHLGRGMKDTGDCVKVFSRQPIPANLT